MVAPATQETPDERGCMMQGHVSLQADRLVARRSAHDVTSHPGLAVDVMYGDDGLGPHFRLLISADEARALAVDLWAAAAAATFESERKQASP